MSDDDNAPDRVTFRVTVPAAAGRQAEAFARAHARRPLENVLAGVVDDLARVATQPDTWEHRYLTGWLARQA
ncbi:MAG: hypothetical protein ACREIA_25225, partial [Opitutaceae bacterium]